MKVPMKPIVIFVFGTVTIGIGGQEIKRTSGYFPNDSIMKFGQNTETSPVDLRRLQ